MIEAWDIFLGAVIVAVAGAFVRGVFSVVRAFRDMRRDLSTILKTDAAQSETLRMLAEIQRPQLVAHKVALEAFKGECNGNVDSAHADIMAATKDYDAFLASKIGV
jgi:hypothetical protein